MFTDPALRWPLFIAMMMMLSQQFSGINVVSYFVCHFQDVEIGIDIFKNSSVIIENGFFRTMGSGNIFECCQFEKLECSWKLALKQEGY